MKWTRKSVLAVLVVCALATSGFAESKLRVARSAKSAGRQGYQSQRERTLTSSSSKSFVPVPIDKLANYKSLRKKTTKAEFQQAYNAAMRIAKPLAGLSREEQLRGIATALRRMLFTEVLYTTEIPHYNDPYGYFIVGVASCAGATRAAGLCLNILGIPYEHVHENKWDHQWCRVKVGNAYWVCDAFIFYVGPEPAPYKHPRA